MAMRVVALFVGLMMGLSLLPVTEGQATDVEAVDLRRLGYPVQAVVDEIPRIVSLAIEESRFSGAPRAAVDRLDALEAFVEGFTDLRPAAGTAASEVEVHRAFQFAVELVERVAPLLDHVATVEVVHARCHAWATNVTGPEFLDWQDSFRTGRDGLAVLLASLADRSGGLPVVVDREPLDEAVERLRAWQVDSAGNAETCMVGLQNDLVARGLLEPPPPEAPLRQVTVWPRVAHLTGAVSVSGIATSGRVTVEAPSLSWNRTVTPLADVFAVPFAVPLNASLGDHRVFVRIESGENLTVPITVSRAPATLLVDFPRTLRSTADGVMHVRLFSPVPDVTDQATVLINGSIEGRVVLVGGVASFSFTTDGHREHVEGWVSYPGSPAVAAVSAMYSRSVSPDLVAAAAAPVAQEDTLGTVWVFVAGLALIAVVLGVRNRRWRTGEPIPMDSRRPGRRLPPRPSAKTGLVRAFSSFHGFLVAVGRIPRGAPASGVAPFLGGDSVQGAQVVRDFERLRYGGERLAPEHEKRSTSRVVASWLRLARSGHAEEERDLQRRRIGNR